MSAAIEASRAARAPQVAASAWAGPAPSFDTVLRRRAWTGSLGVMGIAAWLALWVFMAVGVLVPLADAVGHLEETTHARAPAATYEDPGAGVHDARSPAVPRA